MPPAILSPAQTPRRNHRRLVTGLLMLIAAAFAFGFALVPLYDAFCEATGLNGKTAGRPSATRLPTGGSGIDPTRRITVEFTDTVMPGLPWEVVPLTAHIDTHPGELQQVRYRVRNLSDRPLVAQAVPSVSPGVAAQSFEKLECFCFSQQALGPGETRELPVTFLIKRELDADVHTITLAYAFFNISGISGARDDKTR